MRPLLEPSPDAARRLAGVFAAVLTVATAALVVGHVRDYFFVVDDYALVGQSLSTAPAAILREPMFGFYRPVAFLFVHLETRLYAWEAPWAFAAMSLLLHACNAALVAALTRRLTGDAVAGVVAGALFVASPWAAETFLWTSGRFDLLAALGTLAALLLAHAVGEGRARWWFATPAMFALTLLAVASKEHAAVLPALVAGMAVVFPCAPGGRRRTLAASIASAAAVAAYLLVRERLLPSLGGAYGELFGLVAQTDVPRALFGFATAFVWWPMPTIDPAAGLATALLVVPALGVVLPLLLRHARVEWAVQAGCLLLAALNLGPTIWAPPSGRFLYLPGAWVAVAAGVCVGQWLRGPARTRIARVAAIAPLAIVIVYAFVSLHTQVGWWTRATQAARTGVTSFAQSIDRDIAAVHITDLPFRCAEGPVILTSYAFQYYYAGHAVPAIRSTAQLVRCEGDRLEVVSAFPDPLAAAQDPPPGEVEIEIQAGRATR